MSASKETTAQRVLIVDDRDDDVFLLMRALKKAGVPYSIDCAGNGVQAINYLAGCLGNPPGPELPSMVLLDLKMPMMDGHEVLAWIRSQPELANLQVYVLSTSHLEQDVAKAKASGVADYWFKPNSLAGYYDLAAKIKALLFPSPGPA
jgi:CheY-like chemotaxis protein